MSELEHPRQVVELLRDASTHLGFAHHAAGETEGDRTDLVGPVRDVIFGLTSAVDALAALIEQVTS